MRFVAVSRWVDRLQWALLGPRGAAGRVVLSSILAGGICGGGLLVGGLAVLDRGSPGLHLLLAPVLFLLGTVLGLVHGFVLAFIGRARWRAGSDAVRKGLVGAGASLPLLPLSWLISSSIAVSTALRTEARMSWLIVSLGGTLVGLSVCAWATLEAWRLVRGSSEQTVPSARTAAPERPAVPERTASSGRNPQPGGDWMDGARL